MLVAGAVARLRPHAADAFRTAPGRPGADLRRANAGSGFRRAAPSPPTRRATSNCSRKIAISPAPPSCSIPTAARCSAPSRSAAKSAGSGSTPRSAAPSISPIRRKRTPRADAVAARRLRIDVRLRAARRRAPRRAAGGARDGASDLARRPPRRSDRGELFGRGSRAGAARHRPARAIHRRDGRARSNLLDLALRIPPWEPMHALTRDELRRTRLATDDGRRAGRGDGCRIAAGAAIAAAAAHDQRRARDARSASSAGRWSIAHGVAALARRHPLTVEGEDIGSFDLDGGLRRRQRQLRRQLCRAPPRRRACAAAGPSSARSRVRRRRQHRARSRWCRRSAAASRTSSSPIATGSGAGRADRRLRRAPAITRW